ncbi:biotin--[acetyl-CoA-carboxylase] ligase [Blattabacterium cuenoti]|uniref:biotin--[acetyl-CoA-carboxylase] ligase n=1 Tax=Blattabacterium cuenoti TaxID=1653831 RepID=UPI00163C1946|nr:biotin--[acetyl-CoA-carboxylase] ligase [Blattabacterium cuenoti]
MKKLIWPIHLILLKKVDSTNQYAKKYFSIRKKNWTIIWTINQTNGNGTENNIWYTEKYKNLTFSIILTPISPISIEKKYIINLITSNAIHKILCNHYQHYYDGLFSIKWPNDIILNNKKIGGILIENNIFLNKIYYFIIGIGLNVNQTKFDEKWNASSLKKIFQINFQLDYLLYKIVSSIQKEYFLYTKIGEKIIREYYIHHLYLKDVNSLFYFQKRKKIFKGIIRSITDKGFLVIEHNSKLYSFFNKEIQIIR